MAAEFGPEAGRLAELFHKVARPGVLEDPGEMGGGVWRLALSSGTIKLAGATAAVPMAEMGADPVIAGLSGAESVAADATAGAWSNCKIKPTASVSEASDVVTAPGLEVVAAAALSWRCSEEEREPSVVVVDEVTLRELRWIEAANILDQRPAKVLMDKFPRIHSVWNAEM